MPAYFSVDFEIKKSPFTIKKFCSALIKAGLIFKDGYWAKNDTFEDVIQWNQEKLDKNFQLGDDEHYANGYKQMRFEYGNFSEIRLFLMNYKEESSFYFHLIIPEEDFVECIEIEEKIYVRKRAERMDIVKELAKKIWCGTEVLCVQASWESSNCSPTVSEIKHGTKPQIEPFCIIPTCAYNNDWGLSFIAIDNEGIFMEISKNWFLM